MQTNHLKMGQKIDLGDTVFSKKVVIQFAKQFDPLYFHTNEEIANKSIFKGLVCSGSQAFNYFYANRWVPLFGHSVIAGLSVKKWLFKKPIYAEDKINAICKIENIANITDEKKMIITWVFEIYNSKGEQAQILELKILHQKN